MDERHFFRQIFQLSNFDLQKIKDNVVSETLRWNFILTFLYYKVSNFNIK